MNEVFDFKKEKSNQQTLDSFICNQIKIDWEKVLYCEAIGSYTWIKFENNIQIIKSKRIGLVCKMMPNVFFNRCHDKYAVNLKKITKIKLDKPKGVILNNNVFIPISRRKMSDFKKCLENVIM